MFVFLTNDKSVIKIVQYGIIFLVLMFMFLLNKLKNIFLILINLKLIQGLKSSVRWVRLYTKIYLSYICQILETSTILYV